jgi:hypothetical protein
VTKVSTVETIAIEEFFVPVKWLSSLTKSISSRLMTSFSSDHITSLFYRYKSGIFYPTRPGQLIVFLCFCRIVIVSGCTFDKLDGFFIS